MKISHNLMDSVKSLPAEPGIYKFFDKNRELLYIGKAKSLKKRVPSYFNSKKQTLRVEHMIKQIHSVEFTITNSELEALILETNLIKEFRPKYNILMKDDKNYVYIKVSENEDFPVVSVTRRIDDDKAHYFGPKTSAREVYQVLELLRRLFPIRNCNLGIELLRDFEESCEVRISRKTINYPCLEYHIKRCAAPCIGAVSQKKYQEMILNICRFLGGHTSAVENNLKVEMATLVSERKFEKAAILRDKLAAIANLTQRQIISAPAMFSRDIVNYVINENDIILTLLIIRNGKLINQEHFRLGGRDLSELSSEEILESLLIHYYTLAADIPDEVVVPHELANQAVIENFLKSKNGKKVAVIIPKKGIKDQLLELARRNSLLYAHKIQSKAELEKLRTEGALKALGELLELKVLPKRIETYDISHLGGTETAASMIVFEKGRPNKAMYRRFKLKSVQGKIDDFAALAEIARRRIKYLKEEKNEKFFKKLKFKELKFKQLPKAWQREVFKERSFFLASEGKKHLALAVLYRISAKVMLLEKWLLNENWPEDWPGKYFMRQMMKRYDLRRVYAIGDEQFPFLEWGLREIRIFPQELEQQFQIIEKQAKRIMQRLVLEFPKIDASFLTRPDLMIIDGGKGQLSSVKKVLYQEGFSDIPIAAIAKKEEEIFLPQRKESIRLEKDNPVLHLVQRMRDEAHRFALDYHKKMRSKNFL